jgi:hypothetical protein
MELKQTFDRKTPATVSQISEFIEHVQRAGISMRAPLRVRVNFTGGIIEIASATMTEEDSD